MTCALLMASCIGLITAWSERTDAAPADERTISIYNIHNRETTTVTFKRNGKYIPEGLEKVNWAMRDWRREEPTKMDPKLIDLIWEIHNELGSQKPIHLISGYRSPATNAMLRKTQGGQAKKSQHMLGKAADIHFPDVPTKRLRYSGLIREQGGVGYYPTSGVPFVHIDTGRVRHWPRVPRTELALLFPGDRSRHVPSDGRALTRGDYAKAQAKNASLATEIAQFHDLRANPNLARTLVASLPSTGDSHSPSAQPGSRESDWSINVSLPPQPKLVRTGHEKIVVASLPAQRSAQPAARPATMPGTTARTIPTATRAVEQEPQRTIDRSGRSAIGIADLLKIPEPEAVQPRPSVKVASLAPVTGTRSLPSAAAENPTSEAAEIASQEVQERDRVGLTALITSGFNSVRDWLGGGGENAAAAKRTEVAPATKIAVARLPGTNAEIGTQTGTETGTEAGVETGLDSGRKTEAADTADMDATGDTAPGTAPGTAPNAAPNTAPAQATWSVASLPEPGTFSSASGGPTGAEWSESRTDGELSAAHSWATAPDYDPDHPDEFSYRPYPVGPLLTAEASIDDPLLQQMIHPNLEAARDLIDMEEDSRIGFRPGLRIAQAVQWDRFTAEDLMQAAQQAAGAATGRMVRTAARE